MYHMYTAVLRSVCSYKFLEISLFRKKSNASDDSGAKISHRAVRPHTPEIRGFFPKKAQEKQEAPEEFHCSVTNVRTPFYMLSEMLFNLVRILFPTTLIPAIATTAMRLAISAYSIAVAPAESLLINFVSLDNMFNSP
jgi:hypothetical protein